MRNTVYAVVMLLFTPLLFSQTNLPSGENAYCTSNTDAGCFVGNQTDGTASLPQAAMYTGLDGTPAPESTVHLACGADLQTAINQLTAGQTLVVPSVCNGQQNKYTGTFNLPVVAGASASKWNIIETDQVGSAGFPLEHVRVTPCAVNQASVPNYPSYTCSSPAFLMPQLITPSHGPALTVSQGANFWRVIGIQIIEDPTNTTNNQGSLVDLSNGANHIIFDRDLIQGIPVNCVNNSNVYSCAHDVAHGVDSSNSSYVAVINSWIYDIACPQGSCLDAIAFSFGGNSNCGGSGPCESVKKLYNNLLAAAGESWMSGGGGIKDVFNPPVLTPTDFEIRKNHSYKPVSWQLAVGASGKHPIIKNNGEIKNASRVLIEGNVFENNWTGWQTDQNGFGAFAGAKNQNSTYIVQASSDGSGTLTGPPFGGTSQPFEQDVVSANCATPDHCNVIPVCAPGQCSVSLSNSFWQAQTWAQGNGDTVITVASTDPNCSITQTCFPPSGTAKFQTCRPGLNPDARVSNVTLRYNDFRNLHNGIGFGASLSSNCNDISQGTSAGSIHDNLFQGINTALSNGTSLNTDSTCFDVVNGQNNPVEVQNYQLQHNTCVGNWFGPHALAGLDVSIDITNTTTDGSTGAYIANVVKQNNIGPAGGIIGYKQGTLYPHGLSAGLAQQSCTPPVTGATCTWIYTQNVLGIGLWDQQTYNQPTPEDGASCGKAGQPLAPCFPSGSAFASIFTQYNGPAGQPGYLGNYNLVTGSPYIGAGTDGKNLGANIATIANLTAGVRHDTVYTACTITTTSLANGTKGQLYSQQLQGTSASDMQFWQLTATSGSLPPKLTLSLGGLISGTPSASGTYSFTVQMMDAAQQYATQNLSITIN